ncbi:MAG TPA: pyridoxal-dependent decarboxylase [Microvirga sp.]|jgi:glutamate/tyrosine decarboxylase-like PLP-dependent enzyme
MPLDPQSLDPADWDAFERDAQAALTGMIRHLRQAGEGRVWQPAPDEVRTRFRSGLPRAPRDLADVLQDFDETIRPYATGNTHPMFFGWVHGAGTPVGMVAEMLAAGLNANCGGRNHIGIEVERQIARWSAELFGFPRDASGLFVTGTSGANLLALLVARHKAAGATRIEGLRAQPRQLTAYASEEAHRCIAQAMEASGIGSAHLRLVPVDARGALQLDALRHMIAHDRAEGFEPFFLVGTAGTVNCGAFDDLAALGRIAREEGIWFHVDGAFGALVALAPALRPLVRGIETADSLAFDFHKWAHVPYDAGFVLVRDPTRHRQAFGSEAAYLQREPAGLAAGGVWPCDLGLDLSRGFRALKTWFTFQTLGADRIGDAIAGSVRLAASLRRHLAASGVFTVEGPGDLNIVCFGARGDHTGDLNRRIVIDLHERGVAAPSTTNLHGKTLIRAAILNHRTTEDHIVQFVQELMISALRAVVAPNGSLERRADELDPEGEAGLSEGLGLFGARRA